MKKTIRKTYPLEVSIGLLLLIFGTTFFLSGQLFSNSPNEQHGLGAYTGMFLVSCAVLVMVLVLWEEILFPIRIKPTDASADFRNHRTKLKIQVLIYSVIPAIFVLLYLTYDVDLIRFSILAAICIASPLVGKLISGVRNYNDFLRLTADTIEYRNNDKTGLFRAAGLESITLVRDQRGALHRILVSENGNETVIEIDEMELEAYFATIDEFIRVHYGDLVLEVES